MSTKTEEDHSARNLYGHLFDFYPTHKTFLTTNHKPIVRGTDEGIWRRVQLVPFTACIDSSKLEKDFRERRLMPELAGILNFALEGLAAYLKEGLNPPAAIVGSTEGYRREMDVVGQWLSDRCVADPNATVATADAYASYDRWADEEVGWKIQKIKFRRHLADRGYDAIKGTHGQRRIKGLRIKTAVETSTAAEDAAPTATTSNGSNLPDAPDAGTTDKLIDARIRELIGQPVAADGEQDAPVTHNGERPLRKAA